MDISASPGPWTNRYDLRTKRWVIEYVSGSNGVTFPVGTVDAGIKDVMLMTAAAEMRLALEVVEEELKWAISAGRATALTRGCLRVVRLAIEKSKGGEATPEFDVE